MGDGTARRLGDDCIKCLVLGMLAYRWLFFVENANYLTLLSAIYIVCHEFYIIFNISQIPSVCDSANPNQTFNLCDLTPVRMIFLPVHTNSHKKNSVHII